MNLNNAVRKFLAVLLALAGPAGVQADEDLSLYKDLSEKISSDSYMLTKISLEGASWDIQWDTQADQFVALTPYVGFRIYQDGKVEKYLRAGMIVAAVYGNKYDDSQYRLIDLKKFYIEKGMAARQVAEHLNELYKASTIFHDASGGLPAFYFKSGEDWYYLARYERADFSVGTLQAFKKFSASHSDKEYNMVPLAQDRSQNYGFDHDWKNKGNVIRLDEYKQTHTQSSMNQYLPKIPTESLGVGYFSLTFNAEVLRFKLHTQKEIFSTGKYQSYSRVIYPPKNGGYDFALLQIEDPNNYDENNGLYMIHRK